ncbi:FkbM family methyltransferase [Roseomonas eburnea]|uniref:FkbM family methyltransferase n=1 Tax=Neoroseomonas eburnea TaxID=1346889 RepID=A0A9X9X7M1_9PROT|nr:FkbM family methyltransferase [Neoroseomonas eburnea]MBR0679707.1 FkbM family methyltransferase [Neoroseomonas eburnea]
MRLLPPFASWREHLFGVPAGGPLPLHLIRHMRPDRAKHAIRARCQATGLADGTVLCRVLGRYKMYLPAEDRTLTPHLILDGYWELWLTRFFLRTLRVGMHVADVGANVGYYSLLMAEMVGEAGQVLAVEPNPAVAPLLRANLLMGGFAARVAVEEAALGAAAEDGRRLAVPGGAPMNAALMPRAAEGGHAVRVTTLDARLEGWPRLDLVKIDAEGAEAEILQGMQAVLARWRPHLVIEINAARGYDAAALLRRLAERYPVLRSIEHDDTLPVVTPEDVAGRRIGSDWLIFAAGDPPLPR